MANPQRIRRWPFRGGGVGAAEGREAIPRDARVTFAQHGEDVIARELLMRSGHWVDNGFYVDVGAYHPWLASNTALFYRVGWSGIAIDPNPLMAALFRSERPRDIFVEAAVSDRDGPADLIMFGEWASSNTLDSAWAASVTQTQGVPIEQVVTVPAMRLAVLLDRYLPPDTSIDLMSIDVEGLDAVVLATNDWTRFRPTLIAVEEYDMDSREPRASEVFRLLDRHGYRLVSRAVLTNFYLREP